MFSLSLRFRLAQPQLLFIEEAEVANVSHFYEFTSKQTAVKIPVTVQSS